MRERVGRLEGGWEGELDGGRAGCLRFEFEAPGFCGHR